MEEKKDECVVLCYKGATTLGRFQTRGVVVPKRKQLSMRNTTRPRSGVRKGTWTEEEDTLLRKCIEKYGEGKWHQVPHRASLNRCRKSCRLRWLNYLRPDIKRGDFTSDEVDLTIRLHKLLGNRWSLIAGRLPGRTANDVKNYWNTHLRKKMAATDRQAESINSNHTKGAKAPKATSSTLVKPRPRTFSKNASWLREKTTIPHTICVEEQNLINHSSTTTASQPIADNHGMQWLDNLFTDNKEVGEGASWSLTGSGEEHITSLWSEAISQSIKEDGNYTQEGPSGSVDLSIDEDLWALLIS